MNAAVPLLFLGALAVTILAEARLAIWIHNQNSRLNDAIRDGLADIDGRRADDWSREEWWQ